MNTCYSYASDPANTQIIIALVLACVAEFGQIIYLLGKRP
jgi:hypothetical protein